MLVFAKLNGVDFSSPETQKLLEENQMHGAILSQFSTKLRSEADLGGLEDTFKFVFIRHPFERLASAYFDKFVEDPDTRFVQSIAFPSPTMQWMLDVFSLRSQVRLPDKISFFQFASFVLDELKQERMSHGTLHWIPYTKFCGLCQVRFDFIGKLETLDEDLKLLKNKFPEKFRNTLTEIFSVKKNASVGKTRKQVEKYFGQLPKSLILELYEAYKEDFLIGDYPYPTEYINNQGY